MHANQSQSAFTPIYRRLLGYVVPHWSAFVIATISLLVVAATEVGVAALMKPMLDGTFVERDAQTIKWVPIALVAIFLVRGLASYLSGYWMAWVARKVIKVLRQQMFEKLLLLPVAFFDSSPSGVLISKLIYDVEQVANATTDVITIIIRDTVTVIGLLAWMLYLDWFLALILLIGAPAMAQLINIINRRFRRYSTHIQESMGNVSHIAEETIEGQRVVKTFGGQAYERERFEQANEENRRLNMKLLATTAASVPIIQLIASMASAMVIYVALNQPDMSVGAFMSFVSAMMMILAPMKRLTKISASLQRGVAAAASIFTFVDTPEEPDDGGIQLDKCQGNVSFNNVSFRYQSTDEMVLKAINLHINAGETVAFVGRSGSGKSTLVSLLPRFYDLNEGTITVDGEDIRDISLASLRSQMAFVSQHITLFNDTIARNIAYGGIGERSEEQLLEASKSAYALEFIEKLPHGFDTMVGENGVLLSGGQRQRLAIARALLKNSPILILDEATSALDTESERYIQSALDKLMENRTTLIIAHRLSTIEKADKIVVMDKGVIAEVGDHHTLLQQNGLYAALYKMQFEEKT